MHGLGLGLTQYRTYIEHMFVSLPDHPILVPLLPHVSQEILHPRYLRPMDRKEMTDCLASLLAELGWAELEAPSPEASDSEEKISLTSTSVHPVSKPKGVTMFSHSK